MSASPGAQATQVLLASRRSPCAARWYWQNWPGQRWKAGQVDEVISLSPIYLHVGGGDPVVNNVTRT